MFHLQRIIVHEVRLVQLLTILGEHKVLLETCRSISVVLVLPFLVVTTTTSILARPSSASASGRSADVKLRLLVHPSIAWSI